MAKDNSIELAFYAIIGGATLVFTGLKRFRTKRKTQDTATSKIATAAQGFVEVQGYAWRNGSETTNIEGRKCIYYKINLEKLVKSGKSTRWDTVATTGITNPFYVIDETGLIIVDPEGFDLNIQHRVSDWSKISVNTRQRVLDLFSGLTKDLPSLNPSWFFSTSYRCVEKFILLGSPIIAHGNLEFSLNKTKYEFEPSLHVFHAKIKRYQTDKKRSIAFFDINKDGEINEDELRIGMHASAQSSMNNLKPDESKSNINFYGTFRKHPEHISFIADCHEHHLIKRIGSWNLLMILGGAGLILIGIWIILFRAKAI